MKVQSVRQFSSSVLSNSLRPRGLQHIRLPCPSPTPQSLLKLISIESVMPSNHLILCCPLLLPPSIFPRFRVFFKSQFFVSGGQSIWNFSFSISPSSPSIFHSRLTAFRTDWLDLLIVQRTLKSILQHHSSKAFILWRSAKDFLYSSTLTSIHDYWKNHSFD